MNVLRFAFLGLCAIGVAACGYASARLAGFVPPGKLPLYPSWAFSHFAAATLFCALAPLQFWSRLRSRRPGLRRALGRLAAATGAVMATTGLAVVYDAPARPVAELIFMTTFAGAYLAFLGLGLRAALARDLPSHQAWMTRMTATALTPITQRLIFPAFAAGLGVDGLATFWQLFVSAAWIAWAVNMTVAEAALRKGPARTRALPA